MILSKIYSKSGDWEMNAYDHLLVVIGTVTVLGLMFSLMFSSEYYFISSLLWVLPIIMIPLTEILFYLDKRRPGRNENKLWFTAKLKFEAFIDTLIIFVNFNSARCLITKYCESMGLVLLWTLVVCGIILLLVLWVCINSKRYKK